jgi:hypothetical protein
MAIFAAASQFSLGHLRRLPNSNMRIITLPSGEPGYVER